MPSKVRPVARKVLIVDDHAVMRQGLALLIAQETDLTVCGQAEDAVDALKAIKQDEPDICIVDISLKNGNGIELIKDIKLQWPRMKVLVLSMHAQSLYAERAFRAGAMGYVTKSEASAVIVDAVRQVLGGGAYVSKSMASEMIAKLAGGKAGDVGSFPVDRLSNREFQIFEMIGQGVRTGEIAESLHVSVKTVDAHREHIKRKLNIDSASDLLKYAIQWVQLGGKN